MVNKTGNFALRLLILVTVWVVTNIESAAGSRPNVLLITIDDLKPVLGCYGPPLDANLQRTLIHGYYAATSFVDAQIGKLMDKLDRLNLATNTIVIFWSDHAWHLGDHGSWTKHSNYEQANRIPLIIVSSGITKPGSHTGQMFETIDLYPTLAELAGLPKPNVPQKLDGISMVPVLRNPEMRLHDHVYHAFTRTRNGKQVIGRAIRTNRYRLLEWKIPGESSERADLEIYDYDIDRHETINIANAKPEITWQLREILASHPEAKPQIH